AFRQRVGAPWTWAAGKRNQIRPGAFAVVPDRGVMVGNIETRRTQDFAELKRLPRLATTRRVTFQFPDCPAGRVLLFGGVAFGQIGKGWVLRRMQRPFAFAGLFLDKAGGFAARGRVPRVEKFFDQRRRFGVLQ